MFNFSCIYRARIPGTICGRKFRRSDLEITESGSGGKTIKRGPRNVKEFITGRGIGYPANRKDLIRFAEGKEVESDFLDLLKGIPEIEYNTLTTLPEKSKGWKASVLENIPEKSSEFTEQIFNQIYR